jgi:UDP-N-acetylglucosamine 2-epimerase (non-hydrolysing)
LVGEDKDKLDAELKNVLAGKVKKGMIPPLWDGHAGDRIANILQHL